MKMTWKSALVMIGAVLGAFGACVPRHVNREINAELTRCGDALNAAHDAGDSVAYDAEVARCHANLDRIGDR